MSFVLNAVGDVLGGVTNVVKEVVDLTTDTIVDVVDFAVDDIITPVMEGATDIVDGVMDDPVTNIAKAIAFYYAPWAIPLIDGASTLAKGGDFDDALKATAISYAAGKVGGKVSAYVDPALAEAGYGATVSAAVSRGATNAATAVVYGQDPLKAFVTGGIQGATSAVLGQIDTKLTNIVGDKVDEFGKPIISGWEDLQDAVKDTVSASIAAELSGEDIDLGAITGIISKYTGVSGTMEKFLAANTGLPPAKVAMLTSALTQAATTALAGDPELSGEAFFAKFDAYGMEQLTALADKPVDKFLDKLDGSYAATETATQALNSALVRASDAREGFNNLQVEFVSRNDEQTRLENEYERQLKQYNGLRSKVADDATPDSIRTVNAELAGLQGSLNDAADDYNKFANQFKIDYDEKYAPQFAAFKATFEEYSPQIAGLEAERVAAEQYMLSDIDNLSVEMRPIFSGVEKIAALTLRPSIDEDDYRKRTGIADDVDVYRHYLENRREIDGVVYADTTGYEGTQAESLETGDSEVTPNVVGPALNINDVAPAIPGQSVPLSEIQKIKDRIYEVEGTNDAGGYSRLLGNQEGNFDVDITNMTAAEVLKFQLERGEGSYAAYSQGVNKDRGFLREDGTARISTPVGKYQIVGSNLKEMIANGIIDPNALFDEAAQEAAGEYLIRTKRGFDDYKNGDITLAQFEANLGNEFEGIAIKGLGDISVLAQDVDAPPTFLQNTNPLAAIDDTVVDTLTDEEKLSYKKSIIGQFAIGVPENLAAMIAGLGKSASVAQRELIDYFSPTGGYGRYDAQGVLGELLGGTMAADPTAKNKFSNEYDLTQKIGQAVTTVDADMVDATTSRMQNFSDTKSVVEQSTDYLSALLEKAATSIRDHIFTEEEQAILAASGLEGDTFDELGFAGEEGSAAGTAGVISNEIGGEVLDFLMKGNPWLVAASGTLNAGEAVTGASTQSEQVVKDMFAAGELQKTALYKKAIEYYDGDEDKAKSFITSEILRDSIVEVSLVGATDALLPKAGAGVIGATAKRSVAEAGQEVAESVIVLNSVNKILDTDFNIYKNAAGNFVMGAATGGGTQFGGAVVDRFGKKNPLIVKGKVPPPESESKPQIDSDGPPPLTPLNLPFLEDLREAREAARRESELLQANAEITSDTLVDQGILPPDLGASTPESLINLLQSETDLENEIIADVANLVHDGSVTTKSELLDTTLSVAPELAVTPQIADDLFDQLGGVTGEVDVDTAVVDYLSLLKVPADSSQGAYDPVVETPVVETPVVETPVVEDPVVEDPVVEDTVEDVIADPVVEDPVVEDPVVEDTVLEDLIADPVVEDTVLEDLITDPVVEDTVVEDTVEDVIATPATADEVQDIVDGAINSLPESASPEDVSAAISDALAGLENISTEEVQGVVDDTVAELTGDVAGLTGDVAGLTGDVDELSNNLSALGLDLDEVAKFVGKPARNVTETDVDFVIDAIAQGNVNAELTAQYDVTGDGIVDILDQNLLTDTLQGTTDTPLADTSMFNPATGLYLQADQNTQATLDAAADMNQDMNQDFVMQMDRNNKQQNVNQLAEMLAGANDIGGRQVVTTPGDKAQIDYLYDISGDNIFATEEQAGLFGSPYGTNRALPPSDQSWMSGYRSPRMDGRGPNDAFAQGGQVEDENGRLLRLLGEL